MPSFDATTGALEIGVLISAILFGVMIAQSYVYFKSFPHDPRWIKSLVIIVWLLELAHTICSFNTLYIDTITRIEHPSNSQDTPVSLETSIIFPCLMNSIVQIYFIYRIHMLTRRSWIPAVLIVLQTLSIGTKIGAAVTAMISPYEVYLQKWVWFAVFALAAGFAGDLSVTVTLVYSLAVRKSDAYKSTRVIVDKLILWTIETGLISSAIGVAMLICILTLTNTYIWLALMMVVPKVYSNNLLASLNSRTDLRAIHNQEIECTNVICTGAMPTTRHETLEFSIHTRQ